MTPLSLPIPSIPDPATVDTALLPALRLPQDRPAAAFESYLPPEEVPVDADSGKQKRLQNALPPESAVFTLASRTSLLGPDVQILSRAEPEIEEAMNLLPEAGLEEEQSLRKEGESDVPQVKEEKESIRFGEATIVCNEIVDTKRVEVEAAPEKSVAPDKHSVAVRHAVTDGSALPPQPVAPLVSGQQKDSAPVAISPSEEKTGMVESESDRPALRYQKNTGAASYTPVSRPETSSDVPLHGEGNKATLPEEPKVDFTARRDPLPIAEARPTGDSVRIPVEQDRLHQPAPERSEVREQAKAAPRMSSAEPLPAMTDEPTSRLGMTSPSARSTPVPSGIPVAPGNGMDPAKAADGHGKGVERLASNAPRVVGNPLGRQLDVPPQESSRWRSSQAEGFALRPSTPGEKSSARVDPQGIRENIHANGSVKAVYEHALRETSAAHGMSPAIKQSAMTSLLESETQDPVSAAPAAAPVSPAATTSEGMPVARAGSLQHLIEQVQQMTQRVSESGKSQFQLEWGGNQNERVRVEVTLRDGRWQVEFRTADPELTRYLEKEWGRSQQTRSNDFQREADVAFRFDDSSSRQGRERQDAEQAALNDAEETLLRHYRSLRYARNHS